MLFSLEICICKIIHVFLIVFNMISLKSRVTISAEGYDTKLPALDTHRALKNHFESCGEIDEVEVARDPVTMAVKRFVHGFFTTC